MNGACLKKRNKKPFTKQGFARLTSLTFALEWICNYLSPYLNLYHDFKISESKDTGRDILVAATDT